MITTRRRSQSLFLLTGILPLLAAGVATAAAPYGTERGVPILVTDLDGNVEVRAGTAVQRVDVESEIELPSRIETGTDGMIRLQQSDTAISIAPRSVVEIPRDAAAGHLIARLIQHRGNVFYDVEPREADKLRIETPFLVAVVKGTQFNVSAEADSTTISLFEGLLEIRDPDDGTVIELNAGQIAIRSAGEADIRILSMNQDEVPVANTGTDVAGRIDTAQFDLAWIRPNAAFDMRSRSADLGLDSDVNLGGGTADLGLDADADLDGASADLGLDSDVDLGNGTADLGLDADADLGGTSADLGLDSDVDLGDGTADLGLDADLDGTSADLSLDSDLGLDAELNLSGDKPLLDAGLDTTADDGTDDGGGLLDPLL